MARRRGEWGREASESLHSITNLCSYSNHFVLVTSRPDIGLLMQMRNNERTLDCRIVFQDACAVIAQKVVAEAMMMMMVVLAIRSGIWTTHTRTQVKDTKKTQWNKRTQTKTKKKRSKKCCLAFCVCRSLFVWLIFLKQIKMDTKVEKKEVNLLSWCAQRTQTKTKEE